MNEAFQSALNVLLIEDDKDLAGFVREGLEDESCMVKVCYDGSSGLRQAELHAFDIILLDVMLPGLNGFEVTRRLRLQNVRTPILLLTARDSPEDIVKGLDAGADDYLTKPFDFEVLLARIRARTRLAAGKNSAQIRFADLFLDSEKREAVRAGQRLDLTGMLVELCPKLGAAAHAKGLNLTTSIPDHEILVTGESTNLRRLFVILLDNAIKYTEAGSITLTLHAENSLVNVIVADTGIGIERDALPHVFDRFWRADKVRSRAEGGAGLGLSLAAQIVQQHGGAISVESELGQGSRFAVRLEAASAG